jgi:general secretion pathway protein A
MYLTFYGLNEKPFTTTPDPRFLYLSPGHREALAQLVYGVQESMGFLVLTGEVGTGKTMLLHALRQRLEGKATVASIVNSGLSFDDILGYMLEDFGIVTAEQARAQRLLALRRFLVEHGRAGENVVFILDEAHHLDPVALEHIRLLSNFESPTQKLLQIMLVGQPELKLKLDLPELRQLKQRIALRAVLPALSPEETGEYIRWRLSIAGARDLGLFTERAISRIAEYTQGIPRIVNTVCDHCLLVGYANQTRYLDVDIVKQAVRYFGDRAPRRLGPVSVSWRRWWPRRRVSLDSAMVRPDARPATPDVECPTEASRLTPEPGPLEHQSPEGSGGARRFARRPAVAVGLAVVALGGLVLVGSAARLGVEHHPARPTATVVAQSQPEPSSATLGPPLEPGISTTTAMVAPRQSELPKEAVAPSHQREFPKATAHPSTVPKAVVVPSRPRAFPKTSVAPSGQREFPEATVVPLPQPGVSQVPAASPDQPERAPSTVVLPTRAAEAKQTVDPPVARGDGALESDTPPSQRGANSVDSSREPDRPASGKAPRQWSFPPLFRAGVNRTESP